MPAQLADLLKTIGAAAMPPHVVSAIQSVPRHHFIAEVFRDEVYKDSALPIGHGWYASRPSTVARMLSQVPAGTARVLEVGTGCGWQTALLATFCETVFSIEHEPGLAERADRDLHGWHNIVRICGNGLDGWPEMAPFDAILVCAGLSAPPEKLFAQLADDGVMIAQVGKDLCRLDKRGAFTPIGTARFAAAS